MISVTYSDVPRGTQGTVIRRTNEDPDLHTFEIQFDNGAVEEAVRDYHVDPVLGLTAQGSSMEDLFIKEEQAVLERVLGRGIVSHEDLPYLIQDPELGGKTLRSIVETGVKDGATTDQMADAYLAKIEEVWGKRKAPVQVKSWLRRLARLVRYAAEEKNLDSLLQKFMADLAPVLEEHTWVRMETGEHYIIPDSTEQFNEFHKQLDELRTEAMQCKDQPGVDELCRELEKLMKTIHTEGTSKEGLVSFRDAKSSGKPGPSPVEGDEAQKILKELPTLESEMDSLLSRLEDASEADKPAIQQRIKRLHDLMLKSYFELKKI